VFGQCIYCADPAAKGGRCVSGRPAVADELEQLVGQGIDALHTCDGEFNISMPHALDVCGEIARRGLGKKMRWYAYCTPAPFSQELARAMRDAGCVGIDFGADHGNALMLKRLGRNFGPDDICNATRWTKAEGMAVMLDLLLGAPGETKEGIAQTVAVVRQAGPDLAGVSLGVRLYPGTELTAQVGGAEKDEPEFFLEPQIAPFVFEWMNALVGDDPRFLFFDPSRPKQNYNYNSNQRLVEAIGQGYRGAFGISCAPIGAIVGTAYVRRLSRPVAHDLCLFAWRCRWRKALDIFRSRAASARLNRGLDKCFIIWASVMPSRRPSSTATA
jgi:hypothetical protein